ncbi:MAG TPA: hypothetical protein DCS29_01595 [Candidatus Magasanikbacteria bacterium]|nr:hypothetical protein [Candidatus Magasanikbacteria bacterium]
MIFLDAFVIGFTAAALPGAVQTTVLQSSVIGRIRESLVLALGASCMDGLFLMLAYVGIIQFIVNIAWLKLLLGLAGVGYMLLLGVNGLTVAIKKDKKIIKLVDKKTFWNGMLLVSLHPPTILYFIGVAGTLFAIKTFSMSQVIVSSLFLMIGALACFIFVMLLGFFVFKLKIQWLTNVFYLAMSSLLIFFAIRLCIQII